jgi:hypothetical protein
MEQVSFLATRGEPHFAYADRRFLPFVLRRAMIFRPPAVFILLKNPWVRALLRLLGWYVRFMEDILLEFLGLIKWSERLYPGKSSSVNETCGPRHPELAC